MRPIHLTDLDSVVRVLLTYPELEWAKEASSIIASADTADRYRKRFRKALLEAGTGTLSSAVSGRERAKTDACDRRYRSCLLVLLQALP